MNIVFAGPTIRHDEIRQHLDCVCLPPVSHGDILRCMADKPLALGIIDGYFEGAPSVWHKEILYAMDQGVHVFGSSSMGALRAAELHPFGMQGIGQIFEWYKEDVVTDDDEVAVLHGPEEVGFVTASEPMVNIRATLALAQNQGVLSEQQTQLLISATKLTFYKQRSWRRVFESCSSLLKDEALGKQLENWLKKNRIDLKKRDAVEMLETMHRHSASEADKHTASFYFEWTNVWDSAFHEHGKKAIESTPLPELERDIVDQLRLEPQSYERYRDKALIGWMSVNPTYTFESEPNMKAALGRFRKDNQLGARSQLIAYMTRTDLDESSLGTMLENASRVSQLKIASGDMQAGIVEQLKLDGYYIELQDIVRSKQELLRIREADSDNSEPLPPQILAWYFKQRLDNPIPQRLDEHIARVEIEHLEDFYRLITADYLYWQNQD